MTHHQYVWVSVSEAASRLGVSVSTVRRMIEEGKLVGEREPLGGSRERYRVRFDAPPSESDVTPHDAPVTPHDASAALSASLMVLTAALDSERAERQKLADDLGSARERAARAEATAAAERERREAAERELERERSRSWLDRLLGR